MSEEATIRRGVRNARYTTVPNHVFEDQRLSMEARWLLGYLLSKPDNWTVRMGDIRKKGGCGRDKARSMVSELVDAGYMQREDARKDGKFNGLALVIYDEPQERPNEADNSVASLPQTCLPATVEPATVNPPLVKTEDLATPESRSLRESAGEGAIEGEPSPESPKQIERAFERAFREWPTSIADSRPEALRAWRDLSAAERTQAFAEAARYVAHARATGRRHLCSHAVYLREKRWIGLPAPVETGPAEILAPAFGPVWAALRCANLLGTRPESGPPPPPGSFIAMQLAQDDAAGRQARLDRQARFGWPAVNRMHDLAESRKGVTIAASRAAHYEALGHATEAVPVGSPVFDAWKREHERRGWPWIPNPGGQPVVYFPAGGPDRLSEFEALMRGADRGANSEAAE